MPTSFAVDDLPGLVFTADPHSFNTSFNARLQSFAGVGADDPEGACWLEIVHPDDHAIADLRSRSSDLSAAEGFRVECRLRRADGQYLWHRLSVEPQREATGAITAWIGLATDIDDLVQGGEVRPSHEHDEASALLDALFHSAPLGLGFWDRNLRFRRVNAALAEMNGLAPEAHIGKTPNELFPGLRNLDQVLAQWREVIASGKPLLDVTVRGRTPLSSQERVWVEDFVPVWSNDEIIGLAALVRETTEDEALRARQSELIERLAAADDRKNHFLAVLAHELRNPLAPLKTGIDLLRLGVEDAALRERVQAMMERQIKQVVALVDELLDVSRINQGKVTLNPTTVDVSALIENAVQSVRQSLADARSISVQVPAEALMISGDQVRLIQVLTNLLGNACKYTTKNGTIRVKAERRQENVVVSVQDDGVGIEPALLEHVFEMYYQGEAARDRGLGIGLTLVRAMVELHGGDVLARSDGPGRGAEFIVTLPGLEAAQAEVPRPKTADELWRLTVLLVDDNVDAADSLALLMRLRGATVTVANDGASALALLDELQPQLALLDIGMPEMDGYQLAQAIRKRQSGRSIHLVAITGFGQEEDKVRSRASGFDHHLTKPVDMDALARFVHRMLDEGVRDTALAPQGPE